MDAIQINAPRICRTKLARQTWITYEELMIEAHAAAHRLADALVRYLRHGVEESWNPAFQDACIIAGRYSEACKKVDGYHFASIPRVSDGDIINLSADELLAIVRELRGSVIPVTSRTATGQHATFRYADDGIAGFFLLEVRSMRRFGSPRRSIVPSA